jgi:hypothetical protein
MASIRKRTWKSGDEVKTAWVADYSDQSGKRHLKTFVQRDDADAWLAAVREVIAVARQVNSLRMLANSSPVVQELITHDDAPTGVISSLRLKAMDEILEWEPPVASGVYFLFDGGQLQYVGRAVNVYSRTAQHKKVNSIPFDIWRYIPFLEDDLDAAEAAYIRLYKPPFNLGYDRTKQRPHRSLADGNAGSLFQSR